MSGCILMYGRMFNIEPNKYSAHGIKNMKDVFVDRLFVYSTILRPLELSNISLSELKTINLLCCNEVIHWYYSGTSIEGLFQ